MPREIDADQLSDDALVIRFSPASAERVLASAGKLYEYKGIYAVSVFASERAGAAAEVEWPEMTDDEHLASLLLASELGHINPETNKTFWYCSHAGKLRERGFTFLKLDFEGEVPEHYSVQLGEPAQLHDAERFVAAFERRKRGG